MFARKTLIASALVGAVSLAGCASDGGLSLTTGSLNSTSKTAAATTPKVSATCVALIARIDALRQEGTPDRIIKVSQGKTKTAVVKRSALAKLAELDRANVEYQANCSTFSPAQLRAEAKAKGLTPTVKTAKATPASTAKKTTAVTKKVTTVKKTTVGSTAPVVKKVVKVAKTKVVVPPVKNATARPATIVKKATVISKKATVVKKTVTATKTATSVAKKAGTPVINGSRSAVTSAAGAATTAVKTAATATVKKATSAATTSAVSAATSTAKTATNPGFSTPNLAFPPLGAGGYTTSGNGGVVVTTAP